MHWPWTQKPMEIRQDSSYTDALVAAITANSRGQTTAFPNAVGALEACAGLTGRAFASAEVQTDSRAVAMALTPECLAMAGRALWRRGEIVFYIDVTGGVITLLPCQSHDVDGYPNPATWTYRCTVSGPERTYTYDHVPASGVVHLTYAKEPENPWRGVGPLQAARLTGRLAAETLAVLADEAAGPMTHLIGYPKGGEDDTIDGLKEDLAKARGKASIVENGDLGGAPGGGMAEWKVNRLGANPPMALVELFKLSREDVLAACGVNPSLITDAQGTAQRESYRQFLFGTVAPVGRMVADELTRKLDTDVTLDWAELRASDIQGRARAFQSMVGGGKDVGEAAALAGLMING